jgi:hypothetical protein
MITINIAKYLESIKDAVLDLAEKNYNNIVEALKGSYRYCFVSVNFASSLLQSSLSTFPSPSNQSDSFRIKDLDIYYNNKVDIGILHF